MKPDVPRYVALLRGINLGKRRVKMDELRAHFETLNFTNVSTFIASGNVLFESRDRDDLKLAVKIERHLLASLGYEVDTFVRSTAEIAAIALAQPFPPAVLAAPENTAFCYFLAAPLSPAQADGLRGCRTESDSFHVAGREFYWLCRKIKSHESKVWSLPEIRALKLPASTARNLTTVRKLAEIFAATS